MGNVLFFTVWSGVNALKDFIVTLEDYCTRVLCIKNAYEHMFCNKQFIYSTMYTT